jgi:hypothetical protein
VVSSGKRGGGRPTLPGDRSCGRVLVEEVGLPCDVEGVFRAFGVGFAVHVYCFLKPAVADEALVIVSVRRRRMRCKRTQGQTTSETISISKVVILEAGCQVDIERNRLSRSRFDESEEPSFTFFAGVYRHETYNRVNFGFHTVFNASDATKLQI